MRYLLVTGELARGYVLRYAKLSGENFDVTSVPFPVAALLSPKNIINHLRKIDVKRYDMILIPGLIRWNAKIVEDAVGIPTYKGPKDAADLPVIAEYLKKGGKLSYTKPACELVGIESTKDFIKEYNKYVKKDMAELKKGEYIKVRNLFISKKLPIRIMAEIVDAPKRTKNELLKIASQYIKNGADIIDIGMVAGEDHSKDIPSIINEIRRIGDVPLSIDTLSENEIISAVEAGIDIIVSLDRSLIKSIHDVVKNNVCVIIPYDYSENYFPEEPDDRVGEMEENIRLARKYGIKKFLADLIVNPIHTPSLLKSIVSFYKFSIRNPNIQLFAGIGNVTELIDSDSHGVNALLVGLASELGVSILLTTEASDKTQGSVKEVSTAVKMMYMAKKKKVYPKNLGIDLFVIKEKRMKRFEYTEYPKNKVITVQNKTIPDYDKAGFFKIWIDWDKKRICAMHFNWKDFRNPDVVICGYSATDIYLEIIERGLISEHTHAAYIGKELEKAEIALKINRSYIQDSPLF